MLGGSPISFPTINRQKMRIRFRVTDDAAPALPMPVALRGSSLDNAIPMAGMALEGPYGLSAEVASVESATLDDDEPGEPFSGYDLLLKGPGKADLHRWLEALSVRGDLIVELHNT